jgi:hypothetical protein
MTEKTNLLGFTLAAMTEMVRRARREAVSRAKQVVPAGSTSAASRISTR